MGASVWNPSAPVNGDYARHMAIEDIAQQYAATNVEDALAEIAGSFSGGAGGGGSLLPGGVAGLSWAVANISTAQTQLVANIIATQTPTSTLSAAADWAFGFDPGIASTWVTFAGNLVTLTSTAVSWPGPAGSTLAAGTPIITAPLSLGIPDGAFMSSGTQWIAQKTGGVFCLLASYVQPSTLQFPSSVVISF